jgi:biopolymer transport protein ExbD
MKLLEKPPKKIALNITPLIDVLFILIIFFTVSSTFLEQPGIEIKLPDAESSQTHTAQKVIIYVDKNETIYLNDEQVNINILVEYVQAKLAEQKEKNVVLRADTEVNHGVVINIMDLLRKKGIYKIIISTEKPLSKM